MHVVKNQQIKDFAVLDHEKYDLKNLNVNKTSRDLSETSMELMPNFITINSTIFYFIT